MDGLIFRVPIQGHTQKLPHPHVVLIELDKECWLVPAFGDAGPEVEMLLRGLERLGFNRQDVAVHLDNSEHVRFQSGFTGKTAYWVVARALKVTKAHLTVHPQIGQMDDAGLLAIAEAMDRLAKAYPAFASPSLQKKVKKLIKTLRGRMGLHN